MAVGEPRDKGLQLASPLGPRQGAQVVSVDRKQIIDADERRIIGEHLLRDHLAAEPLLERVEARGFTPLHLSPPEHFAIAHRILIPHPDQYGEPPPTPHPPT